MQDIEQQQTMNRREQGTLIHVVLHQSGSVGRLYVDNDLTETGIMSSKQ